MFGLATQDVLYLKSEVERLNLAFPLISDSNFQLNDRLNIPLLENQIDGASFYKRITLIILQGRFVKLFYPVCPPDKNVGDVIAWLKNNDV